MDSWSVLGARSPSENLKMLFYKEDSKNQFGLAPFGMSNQGIFKTTLQPNILDEGDDGEDEDQLLSHPPNGKKRRLTVEQVKVLEESFEKENKLEPERKALIAKNLGLSPRQVAIWFQNRRARWKTKQLEQAFEHLKAKLETALSENRDLLKDKEIMVEENKRLQKQVDHLMALWESSERGGSSCEEDMDRGDKEELNALPNCKAVDYEVIKKEAEEEEEDQEEEELQGQNQDGCFSSNGKSELTDSPTIKYGDQSEMQDSGRSYPLTNSAVEAAQQKVDQEGFDELPYEDNAVNLALCPLIKLEDASLLYTEEAPSGWLNHQPFIFQHLAVSGGTYLEDAYTHISDQYAAFSWCD